MKQPDDQLRDLMIELEGLKAKVYADTRGIPTIGIGRNLRDKGLSPAEIEFLYENDVAEAEEFLERTLRHWGNLGDARRAALISMYHQLGPKGFRGYKKMIQALNNLIFPVAKHECLDSAAAREHPRRYKIVAEMLLSNEWPG